MKNAIFQALPFPNLHHGTPGTLSKAFLILLACLSLTAGAQENQWQWKGGSNLANQPAVYGQGNFATSSPGGRSYATTWAVPVGSIYDSQPLWMFGGYGYDASGNLGPLNDFWSVNDDTPGWGWVGGSTTVGAVGVYGTQGVPSAANYPSARIGAAGWVQTTGPGMDGSGHLWLFGGEGQNDLWEYLPDFQEWVWMKGRAPGSGSVAGVYGTLGMPAAANTPGGRSYAASWTDANGNFWLFGGSGTDANGNTGNLNDLWEFNPLTNQWTWMGGSSSLPCNNCAVPSVYGTIGVPAAANIPGSRAFAQAWTDDVGNLWLFGGNSAGPSETANYLNDLWMFSPATNQWSWMGGANTPPSYGAIGVPAVANIPGGRAGASAWADTGGNLWLFGGTGYYSGTQSADLNDLWVFCPAIGKWTWMSGSNSANPAGSYGTKGVAATTSAPSGRDGATSWIDPTGSLWLFGGQNDSVTPNASYSDLWGYRYATAPIRQAAVPVLNESGPGTNVPETISISDATAGATIYYTLDGSIPSSQSPKYTAPFAISQFTTIHAIAEATGYVNSGMAAESYIIDSAATPVLSPGPGAYAPNQAITITDATKGASIYYSLDGYTPDVRTSPLYTAPIILSQTTTVTTVAYAAGFYVSSPARATYTINLPVSATPTFSPAPGVYTAVQMVTLASTTPGAVIHYTLDGSTPTSQSPTYTGPIPVTQTTTIHAIAEATGYSNSAVGAATYTISLPVAATPAFSPAVGTYASRQTITLTDATKSASIHYTLNGTVPSASSTLYTAPLTVSQTTTIQAIAVATGYANSAVASGTYTIGLPIAATPTVSPAAGAYGEAQLVTLSSITPAATVYYTTNTTVPTTASAEYTGPITIGATETLKAIAVAPGSANSSTLIAAYNIAGSPQILTGTGTAVTATSAVLNATVTTGAQGLTWFVWGTTKTALGSTTAKVNIAASAAAQSTSATITGLTANTTYYFQPVATSAGGTTYGAIQSLTTP